MRQQQQPQQLEGGGGGVTKFWLSHDFECGRSNNPKANNDINKGQDCS